MKLEIIADVFTFIIVIIKIIGLFIAGLFIQIIPNFLGSLSGTELFVLLWFIGGGLALIFSSSENSSSGGSTTTMSESPEQYRAPSTSTPTSYYSSRNNDNSSRPRVEASAPAGSCYSIGGDAYCDHHYESWVPPHDPTTRIRRCVICGHQYKS